MTVRRHPAKERLLLRPPRAAPFDDETTVARHWIDFSQREYETHPNPLHAWEAYLEARGARLPIPEWVLAYFDRVALRFAHMTRQEPREPYRGIERRLTPTQLRTADVGPERRWDALKQIYRRDDPVQFTRPPKNETAKAVYRAMEFIRPGMNGGPANPFREAIDKSHDVGVAVSVYFAIRQGHKPDLAFDLVALEHPQQCSATPRCSTISRSTVARAWRKHGRALGAK